jgi:hypothetical protein
MKRLIPLAVLSCFFSLPSYSVDLKQTHSNHLNAYAQCQNYFRNSQYFRDNEEFGTEGDYRSRYFLTSSNSVIATQWTPKEGCQWIHDSGTNPPRLGQSRCYNWSRPFKSGYFTRTGYRTGDIPARKGKTCYQYELEGEDIVVYYHFKQWTPSGSLVVDETSRDIKGRPLKYIDAEKIPDTWRTYNNAFEDNPEASPPLTPKPTIRNLQYGGHSSPSYDGLTPLPSTEWKMQSY